MSLSFKINHAYRLVKVREFAEWAGWCNQEVAEALLRHKYFVVTKLNDYGSVIKIRDPDGNTIRLPQRLIDGGLDVWMLAKEFSFFAEVQVTIPAVKSEQPVVPTVESGKYIIEIPGVANVFSSDDPEAHIGKLIVALNTATQIGRLFDVSDTTGITVFSPNGEKFLLSTTEHVNLYAKWLKSQSDCYNAYHELLTKGVRITT